MTKYIETIIRDQASIKIEISDDKVEPFVKGTVEKATPLSVEQVAEKTRDAFSVFLNNVRLMATEFGRKLEEIADSPDETQLSFGIKIDASANALIAKAGSEAQFLVTIIWKKAIDENKSNE